MLIGSSMTKIIKTNALFNLGAIAVALPSNFSYALTYDCTHLSEWQNLSTCGDVVTENTPPTVSLISPEKNSSFPENDSVVFSVDATDIDGTVAKVEPYLGEAKLTTPTSASYQFTCSATLDEHVLKAIAVDDESAQGNIENMTLTGLMFLHCLSTQSSFKNIGRVMLVTLAKAIWLSTTTLFSKKKGRKVQKKGVLTGMKFVLFSA
jgi:hypothetical protein